MTDRQFMEILSQEAQRSKKKSCYQLIVRMHHWLAGDEEKALEGLK